MDIEASKMNEPLKCLNKPEKGQSLAELAISFLVVLFVLGGVIDLGRLFFAYIAIRDAAQEGAVYASITLVKTEASIRDRVRSSSRNPVDMSSIPNSDILISASNSAGNPIANIGDTCAGDEITVTVLYNENFIMPLTTAIVDNQPLPLKAEIHYIILTPLCP